MNHVVKADGVPDAAAVGGKGANLMILAARGVRVPRFVVVTADAFRTAARPIATEIARRIDAGEFEGLDRFVRQIEVPAEVEGDIGTALRDLFDPGTLVAVRSSAVDEDGRGGSFAGLHESRLFVRGLDRICAAVAEVWASAFQQRALLYRKERDVLTTDIAVAVVIQEMVDPVVSGVLFTAGGATGNVREMTISACWGTGEAVVSAGLDADTFTVQKADRSVDAQVATKTDRIVFDRESGHGVLQETVPLELQDKRCLTEAQVAELIDVGLATERAYGRPQDLEFCYGSDGRLVILQTRPITTVAEYGPAAGHETIWDNSNIVESYAGVTSPMTFSFIRRAYTTVYHCFASVMGVSPEVVAANRHTFENMLGLVRGRVYYNLFNWYRLVGLFPGFQFNKGFMESMMGVRKPADLDEQEEPAGWFRRTFVELPALLRLVAVSVWRFGRIQRIVDRFQTHFHLHHDRWRALDLDALPPDRLAALYREMEERLLWNWKAPIINDFYVMIFYGALKRGCTKWCGDATGSLQNDLLCGEGGLESAEPTRLLLTIAAEARADEDLAALIRSTSPADLAEQLLPDSRFPAFSARLREYLDRFGFRCIDELKLERPTLKDDPRFIFQVLRNYLLQDEMLDVATLEAREKATRAAAETRAFGKLRFGPRRWLFRRVLRAARRGVKNRENMRFSRTRIFDLVRQVIRAQGRHLAHEGLLDREQDVFYLTLDEVWSYVQGTAVTTRLRDLAALRKAEFDGYEEGDVPDDRFTTYGMVYHRNAFKDHEATPPAAEDGVLTGVACSPGTTSGPVKVVRSPTDDVSLDGEILVAERTDPGWVPLYPSVSGLLIERGSILSHSAVVAREMGLPTVVGIPGLLGMLQTGQRVTMDGAAGTVRIEE